MMYCIYTIYTSSGIHKPGITANVNMYSNIGNGIPLESSP